MNIKSITFYLTYNFKFSRLLDQSKLFYPNFDLFTFSFSLHSLSFYHPYHYKLIFYFFSNLLVNHDHLYLEFHNNSWEISITANDIHDYLQVFMTGSFIYAISVDPLMTRPPWT